MIATAQLRSKNVTFQTNRQYRSFWIINKIIKFSQTPSSDLQRTSEILIHRIQFPRRPLNNLQRQLKHTAQARRHILRRQLVDQTQHILLRRIPRPVSNHAETQRIEIPLARVTSKQHRMLQVLRDDFHRHIDKRIGRFAIIPLGWDLFFVVEFPAAAAIAFGAEEGLHGCEVGDAGVAEGGEGLVEEGSGAEKQERVGAEVEIRVVGLGLLVALGAV